MHGHVTPNPNFYLTLGSDFYRDRPTKSRNGSSGSAKKAGYGAAGSCQTMTSDEGQIQSRLPSSKSHSPRRRKRGSWGYWELRESLGDGLGFGDFVLKHVGGGEGSWKGVKEESKDQDLKRGDDDRNGEEIGDDDDVGSVEGKVEEEEDINEDEHAGSAPTVIFKERWKKKEARLRVTSKLGRAAPARWRLMPIIGEREDRRRMGCGGVAEAGRLGRRLFYSYSYRFACFLSIRHLQRDVCRCHFLFSFLLGVAEGALSLVLSCLMYIYTCILLRHI